MDRDTLHKLILRKRSFLCVGLDTDPDRIPAHFEEYEDKVFAFNRSIIDATADLCVAYKPNTAFYEAGGSAGWQSLERTMAYLRSLPDPPFIIADAKRGDIGNTSKRYAMAFFDGLQADALTVAPYMGEDSVAPFTGIPGKWVILLALTSNAGSADFQMTEADGEALFERVLKRGAAWGGPEEMMFVVGATHPEYFKRIRELVPDHFLLVPGVGAQGGDLEALARHGMNDQVGLLVNSSRGILYASDGEDFQQAARDAAADLQRRMAGILDARRGQ